MRGLPEVQDAEQFAGLLRSADRWTSAIRAIRDRHGLLGPFEPARQGSTVVEIGERHCIKLHPPLPGFVASCAREVVALERVAGRLPLSTPELVAVGELEGWPYFVTTRIVGRPIDECWASADAATRARWAARLGSATAAMHSIVPGELRSHVEPWFEFRARMRARCVELEREAGLGKTRLLELDAYLRGLDSIAEPETAEALLHTEIGPGHVLVAGAELSGIIDFGDAAAGDPESDMAAVGLFVTRGDVAAFAEFSRGYGLGETDLSDADRPDRLMRHALLHRYGRLAWYLRALEPPELPLPELARRWFGVTASPSC